MRLSGPLWSSVSPSLKWEQDHSGMERSLHGIWHSKRQARTKEVAKGDACETKEPDQPRLGHTLGRGGWAQARWPHRRFSSADGTMGCPSPGNTQKLLCHKLPTGSGRSLGRREREPPAGQSILTEFPSQKSGFTSSLLDWTSFEAIL